MWWIVPVMAPSESCHPVYTCLWCDFAVPLVKRWCIFSYPMSLGWRCHLPWPEECGGSDDVWPLRPCSFGFLPLGTSLPSYEGSQPARASLRKRPRCPVSQPSPLQPSSSLCLCQWTQVKSAHPPSQPTEWWEIVTLGCCKPPLFGVVCYTATDNWTLCIRDFIWSSGWYFCFRTCV